MGDPGAMLAHPLQATGVELATATGTDVFLLLPQSHPKPG